jgi:hypothetical protein
MFANEYEKTYKNVRSAMKSTEHLSKVIEFLKAQTEPVSCQTIGEAIFWDYHSDDSHRSYASRIGQMLCHLREGGFIEEEKTYGEPKEIEVREWTYDNKIKEFIKVHDDEGNSYIVPNPRFNPYNRQGHWETVKKTVHPVIKVYSWIGD